MSNSLLEVFKEIKSETDKGTVHSYLPFYDRLFKDIRYDVKHVLEIGIASGESIKLWHHYFPNAIIYGVDNVKINSSIWVEERVKAYEADAYNKEFIEANFSDIKFDIIIDDGPHRKESQMKAMELYVPLLTEEGIIVIEDVQDYYEPGVWIRDIIKSVPTQYRKLVRVADLRHIKHRYDDLLIYLDKRVKDIDYPS